MQIGNFVLYDQGQKEGKLITVIGSTATIMTDAGPIPWPMSDVTEAPIKVVELSDEVGLEEELTVVQQVVSSHDGEDGDRASHEEDLARETEVSVEDRDAQRDERIADRASLPPKAPTQSPASPPGRPGILDGFQQPSLPEEVQELADQVNQPEEPPAQTYTTTGTPDEPENEELAASTAELPKRFGQKWLTDQSTDFLHGLLRRSDLSKARLAKIQAEIDARANS